MALDCSKRCAYSYKGKVDDLGMPTSEDDLHIPEAIAPGSPLEAKGLNYAEQVCMSRCTNKWVQAKQVVDLKLKG